MNEFVLLSGNSFVYLTMSISKCITLNLMPPLQKGHLWGARAFAPTSKVCAGTSLYLNSSEMEEPLLGNNEVRSKLKLTSNFWGFLSTSFFSEYKLTE